MFEAKKDSKIPLSFRSLMNRRINTPPGLKLNKPSEDKYHLNKPSEDKYHLVEPSEEPKQLSFWTKIALSLPLMLSFFRPNIPNNALDAPPIGTCELDPNGAKSPPTISPKPQDINKSLLSKAYNLFGSGAVVTILEKLQKKEEKNE